MLIILRKTILAALLFIPLCYADKTMLFVKKIYPKKPAYIKVNDGGGCTTFEADQITYTKYRASELTSLIDQGILKKGTNIDAYRVCDPDNHQQCTEPMLVKFAIHVNGKGLVTAVKPDTLVINLKKLGATYNYMACE